MATQPKIVNLGEYIAKTDARAQRQTQGRALVARLATDERDRLAAQRLRYEVFVEELGGDGTLVDHAERLERDRFDPYFDHIVLVDPARDADRLDHVVGVYRVMTEKGAEAAGQFYSEDEYDLSLLRRTGRPLLELGRSCLHRDYRGSAAMVTLWNALADYVRARGIEILFGVASFHGTDPEEFAEPLSLLHHRHLAPPELRVRARDESFAPMDRIDEAAIDRLAALRRIPALIKAYLKLGGFVGEGAFVDHAFNTTDVCLILDIGRMNPAQKALYGWGGTR